VGQEQHEVVVTDVKLLSSAAVLRNDELEHNREHNYS